MSCMLSVVRAGRLGPSVASMLKVMGPFTPSSFSSIPTSACTSVPHMSMICGSARGHYLEVVRGGGGGGVI